MDAILEMLSRGIEQLLGRASGPLKFRLFIMPTVVAVLAVRAGLKDARDGEPAYLTIFTNATYRRRRFRSAVQDIGKVFVVAVVLDTAYQLFVLSAFSVVQLLIVAVGCAIVPYVLIRGPITRLARRYYGKPARPAGVSSVSTSEDLESRSEIRDAGRDHEEEDSVQGIEERHRRESMGFRSPRA